MKSGEEEAAPVTMTSTRSRGGGTGSGRRKKVPKFTQDDKENFNMYGGDVGLDENKSPLPVGFPRLPLQDITQVLRPLNNISDEEDPNTGICKPFTRSQGARKMENVHTRVLAQRISKDVTRSASNCGVPSRTRKTQQAIQIAVDESKTVMLPGDSRQLKEETIYHMINVSSSVTLTDQTAEGVRPEDIVFSVGQASVKAAEETHASGSGGSVPITGKENEIKRMDFSEAAVTETEQRRAAAEEPSEGSAPSTSGTGNQFYQEQKRRMLLSARSSVLSFR